MQLIESLVTVFKVVIFLLLLLILFGQTYFSTQLDDNKTYTILLFMLTSIIILFVPFNKKFILPLFFTAMGLVLVSLLYLQNMIIFPVFIILTISYIMLASTSIWTYFRA